MIFIKTLKTPRFASLASLPRMPRLPQGNDWVPRRNWCSDLKGGSEQMICQSLLYNILLLGGFRYYLFSPLLGEDEPILTHIFQLGWNHQLDILPICSRYVSPIFHVVQYIFDSWKNIRGKPMGLEPRLPWFGDFTEVWFESLQCDWSSQDFGRSTGTTCLCHGILAASSAAMPRLIGNG